MKVRQYLLLTVVSLCSLLASAQPLPKTLLWRISGKDGHHPSYLYGTMHLTDERLFNLGDSLYAAIRHSDGLAIELDANALGTLAIEEAEKELTNEKNIRDLLSEKEYETYGPLLAKRLGKPLATITTQDVLRAKNSWVHQVYHARKMQTFLDAYLLDIARRQRKWTGGVEDMVDQQGIVNEIVDKSDILGLAADGPGSPDVSVQRMIGIYLRQDLEAIDTFFSPQSDKDRILLKRNHKMAGRMDSLSGARSMVFAVGAAHLPGKEGLIQLLRARGFRVEPVFSSRKIKSADYPLPELPDSWDPVTDESRSYQVEMPGNPSDLTLYAIVKAKTLLDIFKNTGYITLSLHSSFSADKTDSLFDGMATRLFKGKKDYTPLTLDGAHGRAYTVFGGNGYQKAYLLEKKGIVYMAMGTATLASDKNRADIDHFLHSFRILEPKAGAGKRLTRFTDSSMAYSVLVPVTPKPIAQTNPKWISRVFASTDLEQGIYYFLGVNSALAGHNIENDSLLFQNLKKEVVPKLKRLDYDSSWISNGQLVLAYRGRMRDADMTMAVRYIDRGNRWYTLLAMYPAAGPGTAVDSFFSSFSELDYPVHTWQKKLSTDSVFSTWAPQPFTFKKNDSTGTCTYTSYDSSRSASFDVVVYRLGPYYWSVSDSAFWDHRVNAHIVGFRDSLIEKRPVRNGDARGWEWVKRQRSAHLFYRERLLIHGDRLYALVANTSLDQLHSPDNDRFFEDFRFSEPATGNPYLQSKAQLLLHDLFDADSATAAKAAAALHTARFADRDIPLLAEAKAYLWLTTEFHDDEAKPELAFVREKRVEKGNGRGRYFFYTMHREGSYHLICTGPFDKDPAQLDDPGVHTHIYSDEPYTERKLAAQMEALLAKYH